MLIYVVHMFMIINQSFSRGCRLHLMLHKTNRVLKKMVKMENAAFIVAFLKAIPDSQWTRDDNKRRSKALIGMENWMHVLCE